MGLLVHSAALLLLLTSAQANAQPTPEVDLQVELETAEATTLPPAVDPPRRARAGRALLATGAVLMAAGVTQLAALGANRCYEAGDRPTFARWSGGLAAGLGFGLAIGGTFSLLSVDRADRDAHPVRGRRRQRLRRGVALGFVALSAALLSGGLVEFADCVSS